MPKPSWEVQGWDDNQLNWQSQCAPPASCPDVSWFWILAASLGAILLTKRAGA